MHQSFANSKGKDITVEVVDVLGVKEHGGDYFFIISDGFERSLAWLRNEFLTQSQFQHMVGDNQIHSAVIQYRDFMDLPANDTRFTDTIREMTGRDNMLNLACIAYCGYGYRHPGNYNAKLLTIPDLSPDIDLVSLLITPEYLENPLNQENTPLGLPKELPENVLPSDLHLGSSSQDLNQSQPYNMDDPSLPDRYSRPWEEETGFDLSPGVWENDNDGFETQMNNRYISETSSSQDHPMAQLERTHLETVNSGARSDVHREHQSPESQRMHGSSVQGTPEPQVSQEAQEPPATHGLSVPEEPQVSEEQKGPQDSHEQHVPESQEPQQSQEQQQPQEPEAQPMHTPPESSQQAPNSPCFIASNAPERPLDTGVIEETAFIEDSLEQNIEPIDLSILSDEEMASPSRAQSQIPAQPARPSEPERPQELQEPQEYEGVTEPERSAEPRQQTSVEQQLGHPQHVSTQTSQTNLTPENQLQTNQTVEAIFRSPITQESSSQNQSDQQPNSQIAEDAPAEKTAPRPQNVEVLPEPHRSEPQEGINAPYETDIHPQRAIEPPQEAVNPQPESAVPHLQELANPQQEPVNPPQPTTDTPQQIVASPQQTLNRQPEAVNPQPEAAGPQHETSNLQKPAEDPSAMGVDLHTTPGVQHVPVENLQNQPQPGTSEQPLSSNRAVSARQRPPKRGYISMESVEVAIGRRTSRINSTSPNRNGNGTGYNEPPPAQSGYSATPSPQIPPLVMPMQSPPLNQEPPQNHTQVSAPPFRGDLPSHEVRGTNQFPLKYPPLGSFPISSNPNNLSGYSNQFRGAPSYVVPVTGNQNLHFPPNVRNPANATGNGFYRPVPVQGQFPLGFTAPPNMIAPQLNPNFLAHQQHLANMNLRQQYQANNNLPLRFNSQPPMQTPMNVAPLPNFMNLGAIPQQLAQRPADRSFPNPSAWNFQTALANNPNNINQQPTPPPPNQPLPTFSELNREIENINGAKDGLKLLSEQSAAQQNAPVPPAPHISSPEGPVPEVRQEEAVPVALAPPVPTPPGGFEAPSAPAPAPAPAPVPEPAEPAPESVPEAAPAQAPEPAEPTPAATVSTAPAPAPEPEPAPAPITAEPGAPVRSELPEVSTSQPGVPPIAPRIASRVPSFETPTAAPQTAMDEAPVANPAPSAAPSAAPQTIPDEPSLAPPTGPLANTNEVPSQSNNPNTTDPSDSSWIDQANNLTLDSQLNARSDMNHDISPESLLSQSIFEPPKPVRPPRKPRTKEELEELFSKPLKKKRPPQFRRIKFKFPDVT